jgi:CHASE2 domain-containing sensor protein
MKKLVVRCFLVTVFVFFTMWCVNEITQIKLFNAFDPISTALGEFELTDYVFSKIRKPPQPDPRIVLVNIGPSRRDVAQQIQIISQFKPKVIGIDGFFNCEGGYYDTVNCPQLLDTLGNLMLSSAISEAGNVVLVSRLLQRDSTERAGLIDVYDSMEFSDPMFNDYAKSGFANLATGATYQEDVKICKSFIPRVMVNGQEKHAFSVELAKVFDPEKARKFLARGNYEEVINFRGNFEVPDVKVATLRRRMDSSTEFPTLCYAIDWEPFIRGEYEPEMFKNSIVIIGFLGNYFGDPSWNDKFFTPLNLKVAGRANPDMFGLVVHANIVAMILNEDYVNQLEDWQLYAIAFIVCFLNVAVFSWIDKHLPVWFDGLSVIIQVFEIILVSGLIVFVFATYNMKLNLSLAIATMALIGPCFDIFKSLEKTLFKFAYDVLQKCINALRLILSP